MSVIDTMKGLFKPKSPLQSNASDVSMTASAGADYRLDLALQNLLAIGAEFAPDDIISLRKRARYGDARWLYSLYDEMMRLGPAPQVMKAREAIKGTRSVWNATPEEADEDENSNDPKNKAARLIRDVTEEAWDKWLPDIKTHLSTKFFYGIAALQVMWKPQAIEGRWSRVTDIRPIPARRFRLDPQTLRFKFLANPFSYEGPFVDDLQKTGKLIFVEVGADTEPLDQRGLLFQCLIPWAIEQFTVRWRAKRLQNFGMPPVWVKYPKGDPNNKAVADQLADLLANGTRASIPEGLEPGLLAAPGSGSRGGDPYEANIEWCARQYDQIILGHSQVSGVQVGAGSKSSSKDAIGLFKDVTNSRVKEVDNDCEQQAYRPYVAREFGQEWADSHTPTTTSAVVERDDPTELSIVALNFFNANAGGSIAVEDLVERSTLKVAEDGEMTLAGNVKGETPSPAEIDAQNKANPPAPPQQVGPDGKPVQPTVQPATNAPPAPQEGKAKPMKVPAAQQQAAAMGDFQPAAAAFLRQRKKRKNMRTAVMEFYTRRQRFGAAALTGGKPRIVLTTFGHEYGAPTDTNMNFDVRTLSAGKPYDIARTGTDPEVRDAMESHPMTGAIYHGVKGRMLQAIGAGTLTGDTDLRFGIGCEHGKHRSVYVAEKLSHDLRQAGHDVTVEHRDATDSSRSGPRGIVGQVFFADDQPRDDKGRFVAAGNAEKAASPKEHRDAAAHHESEAARAYAKGDNARGNLHYLAKGAHETAALHKTTTGEGYRRQRDYARGLSQQAHSGQFTHASGRVETLFPPRKNFAAEGGQPFATGIALVSKPPSVHAAQARIAARVRARLKEQHAVAVEALEAKQKAE